MLLIPKQPQSRTYYFEIKGFFSSFVKFSNCIKLLLSLGVTIYVYFKRFHPKKAKREGQELNLTLSVGIKDTRDTDGAHERRARRLEGRTQDRWGHNSGSIL